MKFVIAAHVMEAQLASMIIPVLVFLLLITWYVRSARHHRTPSSGPKTPEATSAAPTNMEKSEPGA